MSGLEEGEPVFWEQGKMKIRLLHVQSKQTLTVRRQGMEGGIEGSGRNGGKSVRVGVYMRRVE